MNQKHHSLIIATYALLIIAAPLIWAPGAHAQAVNCPAGYTCTPVQQVSNCPTGFVCTPTSASGGGGGFNNVTTNLPAAATQSGACYLFTSDLTVGNSGDTVRALQAFLVSRGYRTLATGYFGSLTSAALAQYQAAHGISEDGYFGPATRAQVNADCGNSSSYTTPTTTSTAQTQTTKPIYWSGGRGKVQIGVVDNRFFSSSPVILGWITLNGGESGVVNWSISFITDLTGTVNWQASNLSQGPFRIIAVTAGPTGNYCTTSGPDCVYTISAPFSLSDTSALTLVLPPSTGTTYTGSATPLSVSCYGSAYDKASIGISWGSQISGGTAPFQYAWSMYGDVSGYPGGSTQSQAVNVNYSSSGTKQAVLRVTDAMGTAVNQTCSVTIPVQSASSPVSQTASQSVTIVYPQKGNSFSNGGKYAIANIQWTAPGVTSIGISLADGAGNKVIKNIASGIYNSGSYVWQNDPTLPTGYYSLQVYDSGTLAGASASVGPIYVQNDYAPAGNTQPIASPLSAACTGVTYGGSGANTLSAIWGANVSGGSTPYTYSWSAYNDVSAYTGGSTQSQNFAASYSTAGTKQAVVRITDAAGRTASATCSVTLAFQVVSPVARVISSITPSSGTTATTVTITGSGFQSGDAVVYLLNGRAMGSSYGPSLQSLSSSQIVLSLNNLAVLNLPQSGTYQIAVQPEGDYGTTNHISNTMSLTITLPQQTSTTPLSYACTGAVLNATDLSWTVQVSGGTAPYSYAWSAYNDVSAYIGGSTQSTSFSARYASTGTKQAVARITDANGTAVNATCSATLSPASTPTPAQSGPSSTLLISLRSIKLGDLVTLLSNTTSPTGSLKSAAIDMSTDNVNWQTGAPCGYWNSPTGTDSAHAITCNFTPTAAGTYYFRTRGTDSVGASSFSFQTLTVAP